MRALTAGLLVGLMVAAACASDAPGDRLRPAGGTLVIAGSADLGVANALLARDVMTQEVNRYLLYLTLLDYTPDLAYAPRLARDWELHGDTAVTFRLRTDVRWHDGEPTTSRDVAFTFERAKDPATGFPNAGMFEHWTGVTVQDAHTIRLSMTPHADPLAAWATMPIMPAHQLEDIAPEELRHAPFNQDPVGNGPFRFVRRRTNDDWVFDRNPDFPEELGRARLDRVVWRVIPERQSQVTALLTGRVDLISAPPAERFEALAASPELQGIARPSRRYTFVGWNGRRAPLDQPEVRRALSLAMDRQSLLDGLRAGRGELAVGPVDPEHWAYDPAAVALPYDTIEARRLLAGAGLRRDRGRWRLADGRPFSIELLVPAEADFSLAMAEVIQSDLARIGVELRVHRLEWNSLVARISTPPRNFDAVLLAWESDPRLNLRDLFHSAAIDGAFQLASYRNPTVDALLDSAAVIVDRRQALPLWHRIQAILREEQPWTFLFYYPDLYLARRRVHGIEMDIRGALHDITDWWIEEAAPAGR